MKRFRAYHAAMISYGIKVVGHRRRKHTTVRGIYLGLAVTATIPSSPSDWRSLENFKASLRRNCRRIDAMLREKSDR
jgi:hypothetical protein